MEQPLPMSLPPLIPNHQGFGSSFKPGAPDEGFPPGTPFPGDNPPRPPTPENMSPNPANSSGTVPPQDGCPVTRFHQFHISGGFNHASSDEGIGVW